MSILVGGTTVIDNSRNLTNVTLPTGTWNLLGSMGVPVGSTSTSAFDLRSFGLASTSCSYAIYKLVLDRINCSSAGYISVVVSDSAGALIPNTFLMVSTGSYSNGIDTSGTSGLVGTFYNSAYLTSETDFATPSGYSSNGICMFFNSFNNVMYSSGNCPCNIYCTTSAGTFQSGTMKLYGLSK